MAAYAGDAVPVRADRRRAVGRLRPQAGADGGAGDAGGRLRHHGAGRRPSGCCSWAGCWPGIAGATYITATAYIADISPPEKRAANFGLIGATFGIGFVMGPALGGLLAAWHITAPFWVAAAISAVGVVFGLLVLPESLARGQAPALRPLRPQPLRRDPRGFPDARPRAAADGAVRLRVRQHGLPDALGVLDPREPSAGRPR